MNYIIAKISELKPLEKVFPTHLKNLEDMIISSNKITLPLYVDKNTGIILDGSHRYAIFLKHGFEEVPVCFVDYQDENVRVGTHLAHRFEINGDTNISKDEVRRRGNTGDLYKPRTTRHFFPFRKDPIDVSLDSLKRDVQQKDIGHLLAEVTVDEEINHNLGFLGELDQELEVIQDYLKEAQQTREYLVNQVETMKRGKLSDIKRDDLFSGI